MSKRAAQQLTQLAGIVKRVGARLAKNGVMDELVETTKWGQRAFLPNKPRIGTTVRIDIADEAHVAMYVHCQTNLVDTFRTLYPELKYEKNRAIWFPIDAPLPKDAIAFCAEAALTYHVTKRLSA